MAKRDLYNSLIEISLEDFLKTRGGGNIIEEKWTVNLDSFVSNLKDEQKRILKNKIEKKKNETHSQHNDVFHEISVACAFYGGANFLEENKNMFMPDFYSGGINVEIKTINNSDVEKNRLSDISECPRCVISNGWDENKIKIFMDLAVNAMVKKFNDHIQKAMKQLGAGGGHVWIVYAIDYPSGFHKYEELKLEIENKFDETIKALPIKYKVGYIHFGKLRDEIKNKKVKKQYEN